MTDSNHPGSATRRTVLATFTGALAALAGTLGAGPATASGRATRPAEIDADNLVAGNHQFTITVDGVSGNEVEEATVVIAGVAFAAVVVHEREPAVLAVDASNLVESESIRHRDAVEVAILAAADGRTLAGVDESQVIAE